MKRGQAAMEFLMTYGWALLIVLVAIAVLASMGVFQGRVGYEACLAGTGLSCKDFKVQRIVEYGFPDDGRIEIQFLNGFGKDISDFFVTIDPGLRYCPGLTGVVASKAMSDPLPQGKGFTWLPNALRADQTLPLLRTNLALAANGMDCNALPENCCVTYNTILGPGWGQESNIRVPCGTLTACAGPSGSPNRIPNPGSRAKLDFFITYRFGDSQSLLHSRKGYLVTTVQAPP